MVVEYEVENGVTVDVVTLEFKLESTYIPKPIMTIIAVAAIAVVAWEIAIVLREGKSLCCERSPGYLKLYNNTAVLLPRTCTVI